MGCPELQYLKGGTQPRFTPPVPDKDGMKKATSKSRTGKA